MKDQRGASLVEVLGASVILGIVVTAFLALSQHMALADRTADLETRALRLAEEKLSYASDQLRNNNGLPANQQEADGFSVVYQIAALGSGTDPVAYNDQSFGPKHLSLQTIVTVSENGKPTPALLTVTVSWGDAP